MRQASPQLIALLNADQFLMADLYTITTIQGEVYRYTNADVHLLVDQQTYRADGPIIAREGISLSLGIEVDHLSISIAVTENTMLGDMHVVQAFHNGVLDGARFKLQRVFMDGHSVDHRDTVITLFEGRIIEPEFDRNMIQASVASDVDVLAVKMPRNLYQPSCLNSLFDTACGLLRSEYAMTTTIEAGSSLNRLVCNLNQPQGYFTQGVVEFMTGQNQGLKCTIRLHESGALLLTLPLRDAVKIGDEVKVYPGCDKRLETCINRFNNRDSFRGMPFVPVPETAV